MTREEKPEKKASGDGIRVGQVIAGSLAAVTAAILGSTLGTEGTLVGAGFASAASTVGSALYLRAGQRAQRGVVTVKQKVVARTGSLPRLDEPTVVIPRPGDPNAPTVRLPVVGTSSSVAVPPNRQLPWRAIILGTVLVFVLGMLLVTGIEWVKGAPLSGEGTGTTIGRVSNVDQDEPDPAPETPYPIPSLPSPEESLTPPSTEPAPTTQESPSTTESVPPETGSPESVPEPSEPEIIPSLPGEGPPPSS